jgi:hypothetical protein
VWPGSDTLRLGSHRLSPGADYRLDPLKGQIWLKRRYTRTDTLKIIYRTYFPGLRLQYGQPHIRQEEEAAVRKDEPKKPGSGLSPSSLRANEPGLRSGSGGAGYSLRRSGSLTRSLTIGSGGTLQLDSGLRLQVEGKLAPDVEVVASLSDQNTPIQPEGTTQKLQELDRVFVQLRSPFFWATLGDFQVQIRHGRYLRYRRKLQGAMVDIRRGAWRIRAAGAVSRGKFFTNRFRGEEGKQGPYQLRGERGETEIVVIAGTERVWVDGQLMTRGEDHDYIIEYATGQITFTQKRLITGDSRIVVDFEYSDLHYPRNLYSATAEGSLWNDRLQMALLWVRETDDAANPIEGRLSKKDREYLAGIGDDVGSAYVDGARFVGMGKGEYIAVDSAGIRFYRFVGKGNGDYQVRFSYAGEGRGSYRYIGQGTYRYVGEGNGNYVARRYLPLPQSQSFGVLALTLNPTKRVLVSGEWALSSVDLNRFSPIGDEDNLGLAFQLQWKVMPTSLRLGPLRLGNVAAEARYRNQGRRFVPISRTTEIEYSRRWDLEDSLTAGEVVREIALRYEPVQNFRLWSELGDFKTGTGTFASSRRLLRIQLNRPSLPHLDFRRVQIRKEIPQKVFRSLWIRDLGTFRYRLWRLEPQVRYEAEEKTTREPSGTNGGFRFADWRAGVGLQIFRPLTLAYFHTIRKDDIREGGQWMLRSRAEDDRLQLQLKRWKQLDAEVSYILRRRRYNSPGSDRQTRLADASLRFHPWKGVLSTSWRMLLSTTRIARAEEVYLKVEPGRGAYRYDPDLKEYVPDPFGDYILRLLNTGEYEPVQDLKLYGRVRFRPRQFPRRWLSRYPWLKKLSFFSLDGYLSYLQRSRQEKVDLFSAFAGRFHPDSSLVLGNFLFRQDLYLFENVRTRSLRIRWLETWNANNRLTFGRRTSTRRELSARFVDRFRSKLGLEAEIRRRQQDRLYASSARINRKILSHSGRIQLRYRFRPGLEGILEFGGGYDQDRNYNPPTVARYFSLKPGMRLSFRQKGRLQCGLEWTRVTVKPANRILPYEMAEGRRLGTNFRWNFSLDYRLSSQMTFLFTYLGRRDPILKKIQHIGRMELKAYF